MVLGSPYSRQPQFIGMRQRAKGTTYPNRHHNLDHGRFVPHTGQLKLQYHVHKYSGPSMLADSIQAVLAIQAGKVAVPITIIR